MNMEKRTESAIKNPDGLAIARAYSPPGSLLLEAVDELPTYPTPIINTSAAP